MKATIVSIAPCAIISENPSITPLRLEVPACYDESNPIFVPVSDVHTIEYIPLKPKGKGGRLNKIDGVDYANSVVSDFLQSVLFSKPAEDVCPGVVVLEGTQASLKKEIYQTIKEKQIRWKDVIIEKSDDIWFRFGQRKFISGLAVIIARQMGLDREWAKKASDNEMKVCPACMTSIHPQASICSQCRTIVNPEKYASFSKAMA